MAIQAFFEPSKVDAGNPSVSFVLGTIGSAQARRQIDYPGANNRTEFTFDCSGRRAKILEIANGSVTSTKQFTWSELLCREERDGSGAVTKRFYANGQINGSTSYFYEKNSQGTIVALTDSAGTTQAKYSYDSFGRVAPSQVSVDADRQYAGYYIHSRSRLNLTVSRAYNPILGRFLSRDAIEESGGVNLYKYVDNEPVSSTDASGFQPTTDREIVCAPCRRFVLPAGTLPHIANRHGPGVWPVGNENDRGTFNDFAWQTQNIDWMIHRTLCAPPGDESVFEDFNPATGNDTYTKWFTVRRFVNGVNVGNGPIGTTWGGWGTMPTDQYYLTIIVNPRAIRPNTYAIVTLYPGWP